MQPAWLGSVNLHNVSELAAALGKLRKMDLMNRLAGLTHLSPDEDLQLHKIPPRHIRDWVTHLSETKTEVKNLEFLLRLHESDQLQITTYIHFCHDLSSITDLINRYLTSSNDQEVRVACDVLNVLMCVQDSVVVYNKCCTMLRQIIKFISSCLIDNSKALPTLVTHLTVSKYRIPYILLQFLEDIVEQALSDPESTDVSEQELMSKWNM
ncbi:uncharacterized protein LOC103509296 [Diaphorina citri]|uniref:Uncharacterized protein LOC103509296 n=1 Tax=Diaphorina citri TaxID=121845 RepID=A0A1S4EBM3_DIACI|nr:uncharacterized protein LOC103509296 [Diaphorina citri]